MLTRRRVTSVELVEMYLAQISKHNHEGLKVNAVICMADRATLLAQAEKLYKTHGKD